MCVHACVCMCAYGVWVGECVCVHAWVRVCTCVVCVYMRGTCVYMRGACVYMHACACVWCVCVITVKYHKLVESIAT